MLRTIWKRKKQWETDGEGEEKLEEGGGRERYVWKKIEGKDSGERMGKKDKKTWDKTNLEHKQTHIGTNKYINTYLKE